MDILGMEHLSETIFISVTLTPIIPIPLSDFILSLDFILSPDILSSDILSPDIEPLPGDMVLPDFMLSCGPII